MDKLIFTQKATEMRPRMLAVARRLLGNDDDAEDAVQDALLQLWQIRNTTIGSVEALAMTMVRNICIDRLRRRRTTVDIDSALEASAQAATNAFEGADPTMAADEEETLDRMMTLVRNLPSRQQAMLRMRHIDGMKASEIATIIGASEVSVRQTLSRARRRIFVSLTAAVALLIGIGTALRLFASDSGDEGICVTYMNGQEITDRAVVMATMEQTMTDIFQSADVPDIDKQMSDIFDL